MQREADGETPWSRLFSNSGYNGVGPLAVGAAISYIAPRTTREGKDKQKLGPRNTDGILPGYDLSVGCIWSGNYIVAPLHTLEHISVQFEARNLGMAFNKETHTLETCDIQAMSQRHISICGHGAIAPA